MIIFLTGFMGTGKTVVGHKLASIMSYRFVDTDDLIEKKAGKAIRQIFAEDGEEVFRRIESEAIWEAAAIGEEVIALGGGAVTQEENWETIKQSGGICICLTATPETILSRVKDASERPLLAGLDRTGRLVKIRQMLVEREKFYRRADILIETDGRSVEDVVEEIVERLRDKGSRGAEEQGSRGDKGTRGQGDKRKIEDFEVEGLENEHASRAG